MNTKQEIDGFLAEKKIALVGLSRSPQAFSCLAWKQLKDAGYQVYPVNPNAAEIQGEKCWPDLASLPEPVGAAIFFTAPVVTEQALAQAAAAGVKRVWLQQGAESPAALRLCAEKGLAAVSHQCIMMFAEPVGSFHKVHRGIKRFFGGLPK
jgi:predicted CoA-binding protein